MKTTLLFASAALIGSLSAAEIESTTLKATFGERRGELRSLVANGREYVSQLKNLPLFQVQCCPAGVFTNVTHVGTSDARSFRAERDGATLRLVYGDFRSVLERVVCTVAARGADLVWRIAVTPKAGWAQKSVVYPNFCLAECLGGAPEDDAVMVGHDDGGLIRNPMDPQRDGGRWYWPPMRRGRYPGDLSMQFGFYWDDAGGLYTAAEDAEGYPKELLLDRWVGRKRPNAEGYAHGDFQLKWTRHGYSEGEDAQPYDVTMRGLARTDGPTDWYEAADHYKEWAYRQSWSRTKFLDRPDLPAWTKDAPFVMGFESREWIGHPERVDKWLAWKQAKFPDVPFLVILIGWERHGDWIGNDYFPCWPSDDAFRTLCAKIKAAGGHPWPWPSGHHWTITEGKREDGTYRLDFTEDFLKRAAPHAVVGADGQVLRQNLSWLAGGQSAVMCPADPWTVDWWNRDVARALVERGADVVQADQDNNGRPCGADCWSRAHGHAPGPGVWEAKAMRRQFETMIAEMRKADPNALMSFEDTHERFNDLMSFVDYRDCRGAGSEWASVFNYVYHEYVCPMQAGSEFYERPFWLAHAAADGQVPRLPAQTHWYDLAGGEAFPNGDFETLEPSGGFANWEKPERHVVSDDAAGGRHALLVDGRKSAKPAFQIARSLKAGDFFVPGRTYRMTVSLKGVTDGPGNQLNVGVIRQEEGKYKGLGGASLKVPKAGEGWKTASRAFKMPSGGEHVRFMFDAYGRSAFLADDLKVEEKADDGTWRPIVRREDPNGTLAFCENWVRLYRGEGRKYLAHGKALRPPEFRCARVAYYENFRGREVRNVKPAVFHSLWEARDGARALMFANATGEPQPVAWKLPDGTWRKDTLGPHALKLADYPCK